MFCLDYTSILITFIVYVKEGREIMIRRRVKCRKKDMPLLSRRGI